MQKNLLSLAGIALLFGAPASANVVTAPVGTIPGCAPNTCCLCPPGTYSRPEDANCFQCPAGYSTGGLPGQTQCTRCEDGFAAAPGTNVCSLCPGGYRPNADRTGCENMGVPCDPNVLPGLVFVNHPNPNLRGYECHVGQCRDGFVMKLNPTTVGGIQIVCEPCPSGHFCPGHVDRTEWDSVLATHRGGTAIAAITAPGGVVESALPGGGISRAPALCPGGHSCPTPHPANMGGGGTGRRENESTQHCHLPITDALRSIWCGSGVAFASSGPHAPNACANGVLSIDGRVCFQCPAEATCVDGVITSCPGANHYFAPFVTSAAQCPAGFVFIPDFGHAPPSEHTTPAPAPCVVNQTHNPWTALNLLPMPSP